MPDKPWISEDGSTNVDGFLAAYAADDNTFWRCEQGHIQNVLDALIERIEKILWPAVVVSIPVDSDPAPDVCRAKRWQGTPCHEGPHSPHLFSYGPGNLYCGHCGGWPLTDEAVAFQAHLEQREEPYRG